jgi:NDP-sugar pyrophosphorylase family protein
MIQRFQLGTSGAMMSVYRNEGKWDASNVIINGDWVELYDKFATDRSRMQFIDYGLSIVNSRLIKARIPTDGPSDLADFFKGLSLDGMLRAYEVTERFYEVGSVTGYHAFTEWLSRRENEELVKAVANYRS